MSGIGALAVPLPNLEYKPVGGRYVALEDLLTVRLPPVRLPDGAAVTPNDIRKAFAVVFRWGGPAASAERWNAKAKAWEPPGSLDAHEVAGVPLAANGATPAGWEGLVIPMGGRDASGNPQFVPAIAHYPQYRVRAAFTAQVGTDEFRGLSGESASFEFMSLMESARFGFAITPNSPSEATHFKMFLKNTGQQIMAFIEMDAGGSLTLGNYAVGGASPLATIKLQPSGDIILTPGAGKHVVIAGDLEVDRVRYVSSGGGKKNLL